MEGEADCAGTNAAHPGDFLSSVAFAEPVAAHPPQHLDDDPAICRSGSSERRSVSAYLVVANLGGEHFGLRIWQGRHRAPQRRPRLAGPQ